MLEPLAYPEFAARPIRTCYGCVYLRYRGPADLPVSEEGLSPGRYSCAYLEREIASAAETPEPLEDDCKERR